MIDMSCDLLTDVVMMSANSKCPSRQGILDYQTSECMLVYIRDQRTCVPGFHPSPNLKRNFEYSLVPYRIGQNSNHRTLNSLVIDKRSRWKSKKIFTYGIQCKSPQQITQQLTTISPSNFTNITWVLIWIRVPFWTQDSLEVTICRKSTEMAKMTLFGPHGNLRCHQRLLYFDDYPVSGS